MGQYTFPQSSNEYKLVVRNKQLPTPASHRRGQESGRQTEGIRCEPEGWNDERTPTTTVPGCAPMISVLAAMVLDLHVGVRKLNPTYGLRFIQRFCAL
jgi:hypothetical protein